MYNAYGICEMTRTCPRPHRATVKPLEDIAAQLPHLASLSPSSTPMPSPWNTSPYVFALGTCLGSPEEWLDLRVRRLTLAQVVAPCSKGLWVGNSQVSTVPWISASRSGITLTLVCGTRNIVEWEPTGREIGFKLVLRLPKPYSFRIFRWCAADSAGTFS